MNKYQEIIESFFIRITNLIGTLCYLESALLSRSKTIREIYETPNKDIPDLILGFKLVISDLTGLTDNGWNFYFSTKTFHKVTLSNNETETQKIISRESAFSLAQGYEAFSTFLKNMLVVYFEMNPKESIKYMRIKKDEDINILDWNYKIRSIKTGNNNNELFKILRKIASNIPIAEKKNNKGINFQDWYKVLSILRHKITHSNGILYKKYSEYKNLTSEQKCYLKKFFPFEENDGTLTFIITRSDSNKNLELLAEYAFLIFKELSLKSDFEWRILPNMK